MERDSAGVTILEYPASASERVAWVASPDPLIEIGAIEGEPWEMLYQVSHAAWLPSGGIAISNRGSNQVLLSNSTGAFVRAFGGTGDGPQEFRFVNWIGAGTGDVFFVENAGFPGSISVYDEDLEFVHRMPYPGPPGERFIRGTFEDGSWLITGRISLIPPSERPADSTFAYIAYLEADASGAYRVVPHAFRYTLHRPEGRLIYPPRGRATPTDSRIVHTFGDLRQVEVYSRAGVLERIGRVDAPPRPTTTAMREAFVPPTSPVLLDRMGDFQIAEMMPWYNTHGSGAMVASDAEVWIQHYAFPPEVADTWDVFDALARFQGVVRLPAGFRVFEVRGNQVLGLWKDELGVEYVQVLELTRPNAS